MKYLICCVPFDKGRSGISVYVKNVVRELAAAGHQLTLLVESEEAALEFSAPYRRIIVPKCFCSTLGSLIYCLLILPFVIWRSGCERVLITSANRRMPLWSSSELYAVVHDLSQYHVPVKYDLLRTVYVKWILSRCLRNSANVVVAVSRSTADDLVHYWRIPRGKILVNYNGIDRANLPLDSNDGADKSVLYVSRIEVPGKNHANLIRAWEILPESISSEYRLVIAGADWFGAGQIHQMAEQSPLADRIEFTGFISNEQLREFYRHCSLYIFPSLFEGFGLSLAEAMACGCVCACSNNSSLGEIAGDAALTFDPKEPAQIADSIRLALTDHELRKTLRENGSRREKMFDWKIHAEKLVGSFEGYAEVFGVRFARETMPQALAALKTMVNDRSRTYFCAFVNADCLNQAFRNREYASLLNSADRVWADGVGAAIAALWNKTPVPDNVNGTDMLPHLCRSGYRIYLLGAAPGVAEAARERLSREYPEARIVGAEHGYFEDGGAEAVGRINDAKADILLVAMGVPRQEFWIAEHLDRLDCGVAIGVGGLLDFASGRIPRAPLILRRMKLEWAFRLYQEPARLFRRYIIGNPQFLFRVLFFRRKKGCW